MSGALPHPVKLFLKSGNLLVGTTLQVHEAVEMPGVPLKVTTPA
jgi:hypothetical protein